MSQVSICSRLIAYNKEKNEEKEEEKKETTFYMKNSCDKMRNETQYRFVLNDK